MNLLLDCGNTRLKWAIAPECSEGGSCIVQRGAVGYEADALAIWGAQLENLAIRQLQFSSVIAPEREAQVFSALAPLALVPARFRVTPRVGVLRNDYATPDTLGVDRWAAAIGAWGMVGQSCLVISAGTATTIDIIESAPPDGATYRGGLILPGVNLMLQSLNERAARLPLAQGRYCAAPAIANNTHDAMTSGAIEATCGAIERMGQRLEGDATWVVTGGNAGLLQSALGSKVRVVEDLVLEGLALNLPGHTDHSEAL